MFTDVKKLNTFVTIVEEGSFTAAADKLNMAQPWVSVQLKQLEEMLNLSLIERSKGKLVKLSASGHDFLPIAKRLLASCSEAGEEIKALRNRDRNKLILGVDPITLYIPERNELITQFLTRVPNVELKIVSRSPGELFAGLSTGEFDLILTSAPSPEADVEILPLYDYELRLLVPKGHAERYAAIDRRGITGAELLKLPDSYHPPMFSWLRSSLEPAQVRWTDCPEMSYQALIRYSSLLGMATLTPDFSESLAEMRNEHQLRELPDTRLSVRWGLMRRAGNHKHGADGFWRMAQGSRMRLAA